ncbi:hypothetical protein D1872_275030 [compost metagenome]
MRPVADDQILCSETILVNIVDFLDQCGRIDHHAVSDHAFLIRIKHARRDQAEFVLLAVDKNGVTGVVTALITGHHICALRQIIRDFTFTFVSPLGSYNDYR